MVVNYGNFITTKNNIMCCLNYNPNCPHHFWCMNFTIIQRPKRSFQCQTKASMIHILTLDGPTIANENSRKLNNFSSFFSYHPMCQLGIKSLPIVKSKCYLVLNMFTNFGINSISFFHIKPNILQSFLMTYMLTKRIPFTNK